MIYQYDMASGNQLDPARSEKTVDKNKLRVADEAASDLQLALALVTAKRADKRGEMPPPAFEEIDNL